MICKECGIEFEPKTRGRKNGGFCSHYCSDKSRIKNKPKKYTKLCERCNKEYQTNFDKQKYCSNICKGIAMRGRTTYTKICEFCNNKFVKLNPKNKFCTSACGSKWYSAKVRQEKSRICEYCGKYYLPDHYKRNKFCSKECYYESIKQRALLKIKERISRKSTHHTRVCKNCGKIFTSNKPSIKYCSDLCKKEYRVNYKPKTFNCAECGKEVVTKYGFRRSVFCSDDCLNKFYKRKSKKNRKEQIKNAYVEPVNLSDVFHRDKGICKICGMPVPFDNDCCNAWGPTVDHIIPLSKGGEHSMGNVQLAHRRCNSIKNDKVDIDFLINWYELVLQDSEIMEQVADLFSQLYDIVA